MKRIAVVEDNPNNRLLLRAILGDDYEIAEYEMGPAALAGFVAGPPEPGPARHLSARDGGDGGPLAHSIHPIQATSGLVGQSEIDTDGAVQIFRRVHVEIETALTEPVPLEP